MKITVITDNSARLPFQEEHGLALYIEYNGRKILFDCGSGEVLADNMRSAGVFPEEVTDIVISHGHYDHCGGLGWLLQHAAGAEVWSTSGITLPHFSCHPGKVVRDISMPEEVRKVWKNWPHKKTADAPELIPGGIWLSGRIPRVSGEDAGGPFFSDPACCNADAIPDELAVLLDNGTLVQGCCHAGIVNTMSYFKKICPDIPVKRIIGGLHLLHAGRKRLQETAAFLEESDLEEILLLHCTGDAACEYLKSFLSCKVVTGHAGMVINAN